MSYFVLDSVNCKLYKYSDTFVPEGDYGGSGSLQDQLNNPEDVSYYEDESANQLIAIADTSNTRIMIRKAGDLSYFADIPSITDSGGPSIVAAAGITVDMSEGTSRFYALDYAGSRLIKFDLSGNTIAEVDHPVNNGASITIAFDAGTPYVYTTDGQNPNNIRKFNLGLVDQGVTKVIGEHFMYHDLAPNYTTKKMYYASNGYLIYPVNPNETGFEEADLSDLTLTGSNFGILGTNPMLYGVSFDGIDVTALKDDFAGTVTIAKYSYQDFSAPSSSAILAEMASGRAIDSNNAYIYRSTLPVIIKDNRKHTDILKKLFPVKDLEGLHEEDITVEGDALDAASNNGDLLLDEMFPQTTSDNFIADWERITGAVPKGTDDIYARRDRVVAKLRARGRIDKQYFIDLAAAYGYTNVTIEGYKPMRCGEAECGEVLALEEVVYVWKVKIVGAQNLEMEELFNNLKPAYTLVEFEYISS